MKPKWAQPIFCSPHCSICENTDVYFEAMDSWIEEVELASEKASIRNWAVKRYCKECYFEYGGK